MSLSRRHLLHALPAALVSLVPGLGPVADVEAMAQADADDADWPLRHPVVRYTVPFEALPYLRIERGRPAGVLIDLLDDVRAVTGQEFEYVRTRGAADWLPKLARGEIDLVPMHRIAPAWSSRFAMTGPVARLPLGIVGPVDGPPLATLRDLAGRTVGVPIGMTGSPALDLSHARPEPLEYAAEALEGLRSGRLDAVIGPVPLARYWLRASGAVDLSVRATLDCRVAYGMAVAPHAEPLVMLLDRVITLAGPGLRDLSAA